MTTRHSRAHPVLHFRVRPLLLRFFANALSLAVTAIVVPHIFFAGDYRILSWLLISAVFGLLNAFLKPLLQILMLPLIFVSYGLVVVAINTVSAVGPGVDLPASAFTWSTSFGRSSAGSSAACSRASSRTCWGSRRRSSREAPTPLGGDRAAQATGRSRRSCSPCSRPQTAAAGETPRRGGRGRRGAAAGRPAMRRSSLDKVRENLRLQQVYNTLLRYGYDTMLNRVARGRGLSATRCSRGSGACRRAGRSRAPR